MTSEAREIAARLTKADLQPFVSAAAIAWCGKKARETSLDDVRYFEENWWWASGLKAEVINLAVRAELERQEQPK